MDWVAARCCVSPELLHAETVRTCDAIVGSIWSEWPGDKLAMSLPAFGDEAEAFLDRRSYVPEGAETPRLDEFVACFDRESRPSAALGADVRRTAAGTLCVTRLREGGLVEARNRSATVEEQILIGDEIVAVGGCRGDVEAMWAAMHDARSWALTVRRSDRFELALHRTKAEHLGVQLACHESSVRVVTVTPAGIVARHNMAERAAARRLEAGHEVVAAAGVRTEPRRILAKMVATTGELRLVVRRPLARRPIHVERECGEGPLTPREPPKVPLRV